MGKIEITKGWKGYAGGIMLIVVGFYLLFVGQEIEGAEAISLGLGILGIRHYLEYSKKG